MPMVYLDMLYFFSIYEKAACQVQSLQQTAGAGGACVAQRQRNGLPCHGLGLNGVFMELHVLRKGP